MKRDRGNVKEWAEAAHFKTKLRERWSIGRLNRFEYQELCKSAGWSPVVLQQSMRVSIRRVDIRGEKILCVYDAKRGRLVSCLPREVVDHSQVYEYVWRRRS